MLNKELAQKREVGNYQCGSCNRQYNNVDLVYKNNNVYWPSSYPENGICDDVIYRIYILINYFLFFPSFSAAQVT